jgi:hypothetical protein
MPLAVVDDNLVTGWGPWTSRPFAEAMLHSLARTSAAKNQLEGSRPLAVEG